MVERYRPNRTKAMKRKGERGPGRPPGTPNRISVSIKQAIEGSAAELGYVVPVWTKYYKEDDPDGQYKKGDPHADAKILYYKATGIGGMQGYLTSMGIQRPASYMRLLGQLLPHTLQVKTDANLTVSSRLAGVDLNAMSLTELMSLHRETIGLTKALPPPASPSMLELEAEKVMSPPASLPSDEASQAPAQVLPSGPARGTDTVAVDTRKVA